jgi:hypothetical protein
LSVPKGTPWLPLRTAHESRSLESGFEHQLYLNRIKQSRGDP